MLVSAMCGQMKETVEEVQKTKEEVFRDRQYEVRLLYIKLLCDDWLITGGCHCGAVNEGPKEDDSQSANEWSLFASQVSEELITHIFYAIVVCICFGLLNDFTTDHWLGGFRFAATSVDVKKRIESLIERDYLERDEDDNSSYNYLAW